MKIDIYSGVRTTPVHTFEEAERMEFIQSGTWIKIIMKNGDIHYLPVESIRQIDCLMG